MSVQRRSAQWSDQTDALYDQVVTLFNHIKVVITHPDVLNQLPPNLRSIVPAIHRQADAIEAEFCSWQETAMVLDDGLRAIGSIAHAGPDTQRVTRTLKEIVRDQSALQESGSRRVIRASGGEPWNLNVTPQATGIAS